MKRRAARCGERNIRPRLPQRKRRVRLLLLAAAWAAAEPATAIEPELLRIDAPQPEQQVRLPVPILEVRGRVGAAELYGADVVLAIDLSQTAFLASGIDVDRDGILGVTHDWAKDEKLLRRLGHRRRMWTSDPGDTVFEAETLAARSILGGLAHRSNRIGVLTYTEVARPRARVGPAEVALAALDAIRPTTRSRGSDVARALDSAARLLRAAGGDRKRPRQRAILLFTDGGPREGAKADVEGPDVPRTLVTPTTRPTTLARPAHFARRAALESARELAAQAISLYLFSFGEQDDEADQFLFDLAAAARAPLIPVERPRTLLSDLASVDLEPRRFEIRNLTNRSDARAVRTSRDGWFDGFVTLVPGANEIVIRATLIDGSVVSERRVVHYEKPAVETEADWRRTAEMLVALRERTREVERASGPPRVEGLEGSEGAAAGAAATAQ